MDTQKTRYFFLLFKFRSHTIQKMFEFDGTLTMAIVRARNHCTAMGYKFIHCWPGIVNLDQQEAWKKQHEDYTEGDEFESIPAISGAKK